MPELNSTEVVYVNPEIIQLSYGIEQANTYLLISDRYTVVIDACSKSVVSELTARNLEPEYVVLTHEHADHVWGLNSLRERFPNMKVIAQTECSKAIGNPKTNRASQYWIYAVLRFGENYRNPEAQNRKYSCELADIMFDEAYELKWRGINIRLLHTPGHSPGSCMCFINDAVLFSGDTMLNEDTFLNFDGGDAYKFSSITFPIIEAVQNNVRIMPGHGEMFCKKDWKNNKEVQNGRFA